jgi:hypothetical protein
MSWQSANDPAAGDASACDAIEAIIVPRTRDLGNFSVTRALPSSQRRMVGPFIFSIKCALPSSPLAPGWMFGLIRISACPPSHTCSKVKLCILTRWEPAFLFVPAKLTG